MAFQSFYPKAYILPWLTWFRKRFIPKFIWPCLVHLVQSRCTASQVFHPKANTALIILLKLMLFALKRTFLVLRGHFKILNSMASSRFIIKPISNDIRKIPNSHFLGPLREDSFCGNGSEGNKTLWNAEITSRPRAWDVCRT